MCAQSKVLAVYKLARQKKEEKVLGSTMNDGNKKSKGRRENFNRNFIRGIPAHNSSKVPLPTSYEQQQQEMK